MTERLPIPRPMGGLQRQVQRELMRLTVETGLSTARIQADAEIEAARLSALSTIGTRAQEELALLVNHERQLADAVPAAEASLSYLRDITLMSMGAVLMDAGRKLGRSR
jgi:hypothetical protein